LTRGGQLTLEVDDLTAGGGITAAASPPAIRSPRRASSAPTWACRHRTWARAFSRPARSDAADTRANSVATGIEINAEAMEHQRLWWQLSEIGYAVSVFTRPHRGDADDVAVHDAFTDGIAALSGPSGQPR
jgi:hypothetical protein